MDYTRDFREIVKHDIFEIGKNLHDDRITFNT